MREDRKTGEASVDLSPVKARSCVAFSSAEELARKMLEIPEGIKVAIVRGSDGEGKIQSQESMSLMGRIRMLRDRMGTISVITNLKVSGEIVYGMLKSRTDIEQSYDTFKNTIHVDRTYMRDDQQVQGWIFVNFIALLMHYRIYALLRSKDLIRKYSPEDVLEHLGRVFMLKVGGAWIISDVPKKSRAVIEGLDIPIMQKSGS